MMNITNETTQEVIEKCVNGRYKVPFLDFTPGSDEFLALLGTPNFSGILKMLRQYPQALGLKTVTCVRVVHRMPKHRYFACLHLERAPVSPRQKRRVISAAKQRRLEARRSRAAKAASEDAV